MKAILCGSGRMVCIPVRELSGVLLPICKAAFVVRVLRFPGHAPPLTEPFR